MPRSVPPPDWIIARRRVIGDQIRAARLHANLTQQTVAERAGTGRASYVRTEQGQAAALIDSLILVADAIGVPLADLVRQ
ncbi:helix-turn-helix domain-containing protein [Streptomyces altiplanensis]